MLPVIERVSCFRIYDSFRAGFYRHLSLTSPLLQGAPCVLSRSRWLFSFPFSPLSPAPVPFPFFFFQHPPPLIYQVPSFFAFFLSIMAGKWPSCLHCSVLCLLGIAFAFAFAFASASAFVFASAFASALSLTFVFVFCVLCFAFVFVFLFASVPRRAPSYTYLYIYIYMYQGLEKTGSTERKNLIGRLGRCRFRRTPRRGWTSHTR